MGAGFRKPYESSVLRHELPQDGRALKIIRFARVDEPFLRLYGSDEGTLNDSARQTAVTINHRALLLETTNIFVYESPVSYFRVDYNATGKVWFTEVYPDSIAQSKTAAAGSIQWYTPLDERTVADLPQPHFCYDVRTNNCQHYVNECMGLLLSPAEDENSLCSCWLRLRWHFCFECWFALPKQETERGPQTSGTAYVPI